MALPIKVLVTGGSGLLGSNIILELKKAGFNCQGWKRNHSVPLIDSNLVCVDLQSKAQWQNAWNAFNPDFVIHAAAEANVDVCETQRAHADYMNVQLTEDLAEYASKKNVSLAFISTDAFFGGPSSKHLHPFTEADEPTPMNYYGETKVRAEKKVLSILGEKGLVLRTNFFGWSPQPRLCFAEWVVSRFLRKENFPLFEDVVFSTLYVSEAARIMGKIIERNVGDYQTSRPGQISGILNLCGSEGQSKYAFGMKLAEVFGFERKWAQPTRIAEQPLLAKRSPFMVLDTTRLQTLFSDAHLKTDESIFSMHEALKNGTARQLKIQHWNEAFGSWFS